MLETHSRTINIMISNNYSVKIILPTILNRSNFPKNLTTRISPTWIIDIFDT